MTQIDSRHNLSSKDNNYFYKYISMYLWLTAHPKELHKYNSWQKKNVQAITDEISKKYYFLDLSVDEYDDLERNNELPSFMMFMPDGSVAIPTDSY